MTSQATPLTVTPADIAWYLGLFPNGQGRIEQLKRDGKIVVDEQKEGGHDGDKTGN
jgi:hypothetical protein